MKRSLFSARLPAWTRLAWIAWSAACWSTFTPGCRRKSKPRIDDPCRALVERQLKCLRASTGSDDPRKRAELESSILDTRKAVRRCRIWRKTNRYLYERLKACLGSSDCQTLEDCFQDVYTVYRAEEDLKALSQTRISADSDSLPTACLDAYTLKRLRRMKNPRAEELAKKIEAHCVQRAESTLSAASIRIDGMVEARNLNSLTEICSRVQKITKPGASIESAAVNRPKISDTMARRAKEIDRLCKSRHKIQRVLNRVSKINRYLERNAVHLALTSCRGYERLADGIIQLKEDSLGRLAHSFIQTCRRDVPLQWVLARMIPNRRPGKITCAMGSRMAEGLEAHYPDNPLVHLAQALVEQRCGPRRER